MEVATMDGETGMRSKEVHDWAMSNQVPSTHKARHQKARLVERHNAFIGSALNGAESQVSKESLRMSLAIVIGFAVFMRDVLVFINKRTPYQALLGRQPHVLPFWKVAIMEA